LNAGAGEPIFGAISFVVEGEKKVGKKKGLLLLFGGEKESETSLLSHFFLFQRERERELFVRKRHRASLSRSLASERDE
jgi:hypothetical protein